MSANEEERLKSVDEFVSEENHGHCYEMESEVRLIIYQLKNIHRFIEKADPMLEFVQQEIVKNKRRGELYQKITEQILGAGALTVFSAVGYWVFSNLKAQFGIK